MPIKLRYKFDECAHTRATQIACAPLVSIRARSECVHEPGRKKKSCNVRLCASNKHIKALWVASWNIRFCSGRAHEFCAFCLFIFDEQLNLLAAHKFDATVPVHANYLIGVCIQDTLSGLSPWPAETTWSTAQWPEKLTRGMCVMVFSEFKRNK